MRDDLLFWIVIAAVLATPFLMTLVLDVYDGLARLAKRRGK